MSRFIDDRGRIFGKVNIVDLLVLLVIVAVVVLAAVRFKDTTVDTVPVRTVFTVERVREATLKVLNVSGTVTDDGGTVLGEVQSISVSPTLEQFLTQGDELKQFESPIFSDVTVEVLGRGVVSGSSVRVGGVPIRVGKRVTLLGPGFEVNATITGVTWGEEAVQ